MSDERQEQDEIARRRDEALRRLLNTPPQPRKGKGERVKASPTEKPADRREGQ
jgi:hypothetical protein